MADILWEVPLDRYFEVVALLAEAHELSQTGPQDKLDQVVEQLRRMPGYPHSRTPEDMVVVAPHKARITVEIAPKPD